MPNLLYSDRSANTPDRLIIMLLEEWQFVLDEAFQEERLVACHHIVVRALNNVDDAEIVFLKLAVLVESVSFYIRHQWKVMFWKNYVFLSKCNSFLELFAWTFNCLWRIRLNVFRFT